MVSTFCALLLAVASASVTHHESVYTNGWVKSSVPASASSEITFTIVIKEQGIEEVARIALDVNDPNSTNYGKFLTQDALDRLTSPKASDMATVTDWLNANSVVFSKRTVSNIEVATSALKASNMLSTRFHEIVNREQGQSVVRAADYSLPSAVHAATAAIFGLHGLPLPPTQPLVIASTAPDQQAAKFCSPGDPGKHLAESCVNPKVIASTYNISGVKVTGKNRKKNR
jgi:subtilase family serine protease